MMPLLKPWRHDRVTGSLALLSKEETGPGTKHGDERAAGTVPSLCRPFATLAGPSLEEGLDLFEHHIRVLLTADQQVWHVDVLLVVDERAAINARGMEAPPQRHGRRGAAVPLVLSARVQVDVRLAAQDRHRS